MKHISRPIFSGCLLLALFITTALPDSLVMRPVRAAVNAVRYVSPTGVYTGNCITTPCASIGYAVGRADAGDVISVAAGTYAENLQIPKSLTIQGAGRGTTVVDGSNIGPVFYIYGSGTNVTLIGLTIRNGYAAGGFFEFGGGIYYQSNGQLTVSAVDVLSNTAQSSGGGISANGYLILNSVNLLNNSAGSPGGGALSVNTTADLTNVTIANNSASQGGGVYNTGTIHTTNVTIANNHAGTGGGLYNKGDVQSKTGIVVGIGGEMSNNRADASGGGIYNSSAGQIQLSSVTIQNNTAASNGGGIYNTSDGQIQLSSLTIQNNSAASGSGGGVFNEQGVAAVTSVVLSGNSAQGGGGIFNDVNGQFTLNRTWLKNNIATSTGGGGINNEGALLVTNSTLSGNTANILQGGGLRNKGTATLTLVTISSNTTPSSEGGAVYSTDGGTVKITSSTIANNTDPGLSAVTAGTISLANSIVADRSGGPNCSGVVTSLGFNLETKNSCNFVPASGDKINVGAPGLGPLKDNGGPTFTHALAFSSPAVDSGATGLPACQAADQRGVARPQGSGCDIGAYETIGVGSGPITVNVPPNNQCVQTTLSIPNSYKIGKLNVGVNATFNPRGGFRVTVISPFPAFKRVTLLGPTGGTAVDLDALFDDSAPGGVPGSGADNINPPLYDNVYQPYNPLSALNGTLSNGMWTLEVCSVPGGSGGTLHNWALLVPEVSTTVKIYLPVVRR